LARDVTVCQKKRVGRKYSGSGGEGFAAAEGLAAQCRGGYRRRARDCELKRGSHFLAQPLQGVCCGIKLSGGAAMRFGCPFGAGLCVAQDTCDARPLLYDRLYCRERGHGNGGRAHAR
jgi:hypothetical protein